MENQMTIPFPPVNPHLQPESDPADPSIEITISGKTPDHIRGTSDDTLAVCFIDEEHKSLRYLGEWEKWMVWDGSVWKVDKKRRSWALARKFMRRTSKQISDKLFRFKCDDFPPGLDSAALKERRANAKAESRKAVKNLLSSRTLHAISDMARADERIATSVDMWDADPWLLNTPAGTVDLRNGQMRPHEHTDYITKCTAVGPIATEPTMWLAFLHSIMKNNAEMVRYLQKVFGYCLVGETKEHEMYFAYGTGANGKGVTLNTLRSLLGDYGVEAAIETFIINTSQRHPTELADLRGARLVTCGETDEGQRWAEARIKMLTGGDPVKARFMRQDFFQYTPQFKLFLAGNHKPRLSNVDEAIERRFRLIPFTVTIPKPDRDVDLVQKLRAEWPQILAWAIEGCLLWQREGLTPPDAVAVATKSYLNQEDAIGAWVAEFCEQDPNPSTKMFAYTRDLFESWALWARENGEDVGTKRVLSRHLEDREPILKIRKWKGLNGFGFFGIRPRASENID